MQFVRLFYCVKIAFYGWFLRKGDDFDGTAADIGDQDGAHASVPFVFYADHDTRESSPTSPVPIGSYGPASMAGCHIALMAFDPGILAGALAAMPAFKISWHNNLC
jgi:hypothetical protein